jgi:hypothetical protein
MGTLTDNLSVNRKGGTMDLFAIRRRNEWRTPEELGKTAARSSEIGDGEMSDQVRWIRSYVTQDDDGTLGTICIYQAVSADALRDHAKRVGMPADEINPIADTVIVRPDPEPAQTSA